MKQPADSRPRAFYFYALPGLNFRPIIAEDGGVANFSRPVWEWTMLPVDARDRTASMRQPGDLSQILLDVCLAA
jgi:hypothetical protein